MRSSENIISYSTESTGMWFRGCSKPIHAVRKHRYSDVSVLARRYVPDDIGRGAVRYKKGNAEDNGIIHVLIANSPTAFLWRSNFYVGG